MVTCPHQKWVTGDLEVWGEENEFLEGVHVIYELVPKAYEHGSMKDVFCR
jgi:hypothetical protein